MPTVKVNDINIYYEVHGEGRPILLIAGLGTDISPYMAMIRQLSLKYKVLAFDNRGVGRTDKPDIPYSIEMMAEDTADLLKALEMAPSNVIGVSMGGRIAMALALQHPDRVKSLTLVSTTARLRGKPFPRRYKFLKWLRSNRLFGRNQQPYYAFKRQLEASRNYDGLDRLKSINVPTLILHGEQDQLVPFELAEEMHNMIKNSRIITFHGGHVFFFWEGKRLTDIISGFLNIIDST